MSCSERRKELKRRRHRKQKVDHLKQRVEQANVSDKASVARKLRGLTPGAEEIIERLGLEDR